MDAQMKKGVLEMCLLRQIQLRDMYGYEIMKRVRQAFPDINEGTVYAVLRRLGFSGHAETYVGKVSGGPARKYYKITDEGSRYLEVCAGEWRQLNEAVSALMEQRQPNG